ncbi:DNA repair protein recA1, chloroplastic [Sesamum alatum]|uniref:DNA repair protein recA1, chloroplastic n=1 Tax=Sesamum alatum TaxID=300844 RepID=A0AAE1Z159_9LAMI|nr:DNA repair protein recA1, chloroplastic [Sesamum alatum]
MSERALHERIVWCSGKFPVGVFDPPGLHLLVEEVEFLDIKYPRIVVRRRSRMLRRCVVSFRPLVRRGRSLKKLGFALNSTEKVNGALSSDFDPRFIDRQKALDAAMNEINSSFGKGSVTRLGSAGGALVETFPSGCLTLDFALGGGLPRGRIVEIYGPESSGKTTLALHAIAEVQRLGGNAMLVDAEHAFDPAYSKSFGVDVENLIVLPA